MMSRGRGGTGWGQGVDAAVCRGGASLVCTLAAAVAARGGTRRVCWEPGGGGGSAAGRGGGGGRRRGLSPSSGRAGAPCRSRHGPSGGGSDSGRAGLDGTAAPNPFRPPAPCRFRHVGMVGPLRFLFFFCLCMVMWLRRCRGWPHGLLPLPPTMALCAAASILTLRVVPALPRAGGSAACRRHPRERRGVRAATTMDGQGRRESPPKWRNPREASSGSAGQDAS